MSPFALFLASMAVLLLAIRALQWLRSEFGKPPNFPPGPPRFPVFGMYPLLLLINYRHIYLATQTLARWFRTDVLGLYYGPFPVVTVHSHELAREVLRNPDLDGRAAFELVRIRDPDFSVNGVFFTGGQLWKEQRRFALRHMRDYGFGRRFDEFEAHVADELEQLVDLLRNGPRHEHEKALMPGERGVLELPVGFMSLTGNMYFKTVLNVRTERAQMGPMLDAIRHTMTFQREACVFGRFFSLLPWWSRIFPDGCGYTKLRHSSMVQHAYVSAIVADEWRTFRSGDEPRHFLDRYFEEIAADKDETSTFNLKQLTTMLVDFMLPSFVGVSTSVCLTLKRLLLNGDCLQRMRRQIDDVVGRSRLPTLDDRQRLPYVEAVLRESLRLDTLVPNNVPHQALRDTRIGPYDIPADTLIVVNLHSAHRDRREYGPDADEFRPERFIDSGGELQLSRDRSMPFGMGKRLCAGETFARNMMFLLLATLVQNFEWRIAPGERFGHPDRDSVATGFSKTVPDFRMAFTSR